MLKEGRQQMDKDEYEPPTVSEIGTLHDLTLDKHHHRGGHPCKTS